MSSAEREALSRMPSPIDQSGDGPARVSPALDQPDQQPAGQGLPQAQRQPGQQRLGTPPTAGVPTSELPADELPPSLFSFLDNDT